MPARVVTVANMKGGVGKTTTVLALTRAYATGAYGGPPLRVLVIDLDAQANASFWLCGDLNLADLIESGRTIDAFFEDSIIRGQALRLGDYALDLAWGASAPAGPWVIPSSPGLRKAEHELIGFFSKSHRNLLQVERVIGAAFGAEIAQLRPTFDLILIDSSPSITAFTQTALAVADLIIAPTVPVFIASLGLESFCKTVIEASTQDEAAPRAPWVLANRVRGTAHHQTILAELREEAASDDRGFGMFSVEIPDFTDIGGADLENAAPRTYGRGPTPEPYARLAREILEVLDGATP